MATLEERLAALETMFVKRSDGAISLNIEGGLKLTSGDNLTILSSDVIGAKTITIPDYQGRLVAYNVRPKAIDPTGNEIAKGTWRIYKNTTTGEVRLWANDNGVLKSIKFE